MAAPLQIARFALPAGQWPREREIGQVRLGWEERSKRRARLGVENAALDVLVDLPIGARLADGDGLVLANGDVVRVVAALEPVLEIRAGATALARLAYHLGNRHLPLQVLPEALVVAADPVVADMIRLLGGEATAAERPFDPEPGAYEHRAHGRAE